MISKTPEDLQFYEARLKFLRDQQSQIEDAELRGELKGSVRTLQKVLGEAVSSKEQLDKIPLKELEAMLASLQKRLSNRHG